MTDRIAISLPCDLRYRNAVAELIEQFCAGKEDSQTRSKICMQVHTAFIEAFNNLAMHAYAGIGPVEIDAERCGQELVIRLKDHGKSFDYEGIKDPDLSAIPDSGYGIYIIRRFMRKVEYSPGLDGSQNVLRMVKELHPEADPSSWGVA